MASPTRTAALDAQLAQLGTNLRQLEQDREVLALHLVEHPADPKATEALHASDARIAKARAEIANLQDARRAAARFDAVAIRAAELAEVKQLRDTALRIAAKERPKLVGELEADIANIGVKLQKLAEMGQRCRDAAMGALRLVPAADGLRQATWVLIEPAIAEVGLGDALAGALVAAGVGTVGARIPAMFGISHPSRAAMRDAVEADARRLEHHLGTVVSALEKEHAVADDPVHREMRERAARLAALHAGTAIATRAELSAGPMEPKT